MSFLSRLTVMAAIATATPAFAQTSVEADAQAGDPRPALNLTLNAECAAPRGDDGACERPYNGGSGLQPRRDATASAAPPEHGFYFVATSSRTGAYWAPGRDGADASMLENRVPVGDASVGVARRVGEGELAVGYVNRDVGQKFGAQSFSRREDFAGVSFTVRR